MKTSFIRTDFTDQSSSCGTVRVKHRRWLFIDVSCDPPALHHVLCFHTLRVFSSPSADRDGFMWAEHLRAGAPARLQVQRRSTSGHPTECWSLSLFSRSGYSCTAGCTWFWADEHFVFLVQSGVPGFLTDMQKACSNYSSYRQRKWRRLTLRGLFPFLWFREVRLRLTIKSDFSDRGCMMFPWGGVACVSGRPPVCCVKSLCVIVSVQSLRPSLPPGIRSVHITFWALFTVKMLWCAVALQYVAFYFYLNWSNGCLVSLESSDYLLWTCGGPFVFFLKEWMTLFHV